MKKVAILHVLILLLVQLHFVSFDSGVKILSDPTDVQQRTQTVGPFLLLDAKWRIIHSGGTGRVRTRSFLLRVSIDS